MGPGPVPRSTRVFLIAHAERDGEGINADHCLDRGVVCHWHQVCLTSKRTLYTMGI
jgi:hypothetical protein